MGYNGGLLLSVCQEDVIFIFFLEKENVFRSLRLKLCPVFCHALGSNLTLFNSF